MNLHQRGCGDESTRAGGLTDAILQSNNVSTVKKDQNFKDLKLKEVYKTFLTFYYELYYILFYATKYHICRKAIIVHD